MMQNRESWGEVRDNAGVESRCNGIRGFAPRWGPLLLGLLGCTQAPVPLLDGGLANGDAAADAPAPPDIHQSAGGPTLLYRGQKPLLDGVTAGGAALAFHETDAKDLYVVGTSGGDAAPLKLAARLELARVYNDAVVAFYGYGGGTAHVGAWVPGMARLQELDDRALPQRGAFAASPLRNGRANIAYVHAVGDLGDIQVRLSDGSQRGAVSLAELRGIDPLSCVTELAFYDPAHLVALYCPRGRPSQLAVADVSGGTATLLSDPDKEDVEQALVVPQGRILWVNRRSSAMDRGALKSATLDGSVRQVIEPMVPVKTMAQLTVSPQGDFVYYLSGAGVLKKVHVRGEVPTQALLDGDKVLRLAGIAPDGATVAVVVPAGGMPAEKLLLVDVKSGARIEPPLAAKQNSFPGSFTADSRLALYLTDGNVLSAYPVRAAQGTPRQDLHARVTGFLPLRRGQLLLLHDPDDARGGLVTASLLDTAAPGMMPAQALDRGLNPSPSGLVLTTADRGRLLYVKGGAIYVTDLP